MKFSIILSLEILQRTPEVLHSMLQGISKEWALANEGPETWNAVDVVGHLIYCDTHNWIVRAKHILKEGESKPLPSFDRFGHLRSVEHSSLEDLLIQFMQTRKIVIDEVEKLQLAKDDFNVSGLHPQFGEVNLAQLFSAWVVHDLNHLAQITRVMAKHYREDVGPWIEYLPILK